MTLDRSMIDEQLRALGEASSWWDEGEFRELPRVLWEGERIGALAKGFLTFSNRPRRRPGSRKSWLFVATDRRIICLQLDGLARREIDIEKGEINRLTHSYRLKEVRTNVSTRTVGFQLRIPRIYADRFAEAVNALLPAEAKKPLPPEVEVFAWIPGMTRVAELPVVSRIISKVATLSPPDPVGAALPADRPKESALLRKIDELEGKVDTLQFQVERLEQNVEFLEGLLQKEFRERAAESQTPG